MRLLARSRLVLVAFALVAASLVAAPAGPAVAASLKAANHPTGLVATQPGTIGLTSAGQRLLSVTPMAPEAVDLSAWAPPVGDQGQVGSCTSWATGYYQRYWLRNHALGEQTLFAPMYLYSQIAKGVDRGSTFSANFNILNSQGIAPQSVYTQGNYDYTTQPTTAEIAAAANYKTTSYSMLFSGASTNNQTAVMAAMAGGAPVMLAIPVYPEFDNASVANPLIGTPVAGESSRGNHAVWASKYDANGVWIENSWGTGWGSYGWGELSWAFVNSYALEGWTLSSSTTDVVVGPVNVSSFTPASGPVGTAVTVSGTGFTGATAVTFNGTSAAFAVTSDTELSVTVPAGATTGPIVVTAPLGTGTSAASFTVTGGPKATALTYSGTTSATAGATVTLKATLKTTAGVAVSGKSVSFTLNGTTSTATTNTSGVASVTRTAPSTAGSYPVAVSFVGDASYAASGTSATLKVSLASPSLKYTGATTLTRSATVTLTATLKTSAGAALAGRSVAFTLNGATVSGVTSASGVASVSVKAPATAGTYKLTIAFGGDSGFNAASASANLRVR